MDRAVVPGKRIGELRNFNLGRGDRRFWLHGMVSQSRTLVTRRVSGSDFRGFGVEAGGVLHRCRGSANPNPHCITHSHRDANTNANAIINANPLAHPLADLNAHPNGDPAYAHPHRDPDPNNHAPTNRHSHHPYTDNHPLANCYAAHSYAHAHPLANRHAGRMTIFCIR